MGESFLLSLVVAAFVGGAAAYLGSLMITRKMALVGDALGHVALPGMGVALVLNLDVAFGAFASLAVGILLIWQLGERTLLSLETLVGIVFVSSLALGFLVVPQPDLLESLLGDVSHVSLLGALAAVVLSTAVFLLIKRIYPGMMLLGISGDLAAVEGIAARRYNLMYLGAVALIVAIGVKVTGSLLVGALVIVPPATARIVSANMKRYATSSGVIGVFASVAGIAASRLVGFPPGPAIILVSALLFVLALAAKKAGWM
ncbi:MAG TPA: metal ABC transporter permease [Gammaproteobacteria bacterium]|nr:metal ABC transporter permease [Gammaproteobacteria bacterium]